MLTCTSRLLTDADPPSSEGEGEACQASFHATETISWLIVESTAAGGQDAPLQAGTVMSPADPLKVIGRLADPDTWVDAVFSTPIQDPVCISQIQTHNGGTFCKPRQMPGIQGDRSTGCVPRCVECPDAISATRLDLVASRPQCADGAVCDSIEGLTVSENGMVCGASDPTRGFQISLEEDIALAWGSHHTTNDRSHPQEKYGWIALPSGQGVLGTLRYEAMAIHPSVGGTSGGVTHIPVTFDFTTSFSTDPAVFGSISTFQGQDTVALRRTATTASNVEVFLEEETCSDHEVEHTPEGVDMLVIENLHAVDSTTQATLPATLGKLTPPMTVDGGHISVPNGVPHVRQGQAEYRFSCSQPVPEFLLAFEVRAPNGNDDSFIIKMDSGDMVDWHIPRAGASLGGCVDQHCEDRGGFHWSTYQDTFDVSRGKHTLHIYGREDGTEMRAVRFANAPGCRWTPKLPPSLPQVSAVFGSLTSPMVMKDDFIW
eukprot:COSAG02_NODE_30_length_50867_cov_66.594331_27_plen_487_part_00